MYFRSTADLNRVILKNLHCVPGGLDAVVGIPRSGILPATLISISLNLPLADVEGFCAGRLLAQGKSRKHASPLRSPHDMRHVLLVDDTCDTGSSMRAARQTLSEAFPAMAITSLAVYGMDASRSGADIELATVPKPRVFEWNVMHHRILESACVSLDGILCAEPATAADGDARAYDFVPIHRPTRQIHALVTCRPEKQRKQIEAWLAASGIAYEHLVMLDPADQNVSHGALKSAYYRSSGANLFIENEPAQAREIAAQSRKPVLCLAGAEMLYHDGAPPQDSFRTIRRRGGNALKGMAQRLIGKTTYAKLKGVLRPQT